MPFFNAAYFSVTLSMIMMGCTTTSKLTEVKTIPYPSSSGAEYANNTFYLMGDDAASLLVLDNQLNPIDSISIIEHSAPRISKEKKLDVEALALTTNNQLWLIGSGSTPLRNNYWIVDLLQKKIHKHSFHLLFDAIKLKGINELNIEGAAFIPGYLLLANRGHNGFPYNHFIKVDMATIINDPIPSFTIIPINPHLSNAPFAGISGLCYLPKEDILFGTASTEETNNSLDDGTIGKSYLWVFDRFTDKLTSSTIQPTRSIDLEGLDSRFKGHKIESICLEKTTPHCFHFLLAADNDNGNSTLFKLTLKKD